MNAVWLALLVWVVPSAATPQGGPSSSGAGDPLARHLFPPELVLGHGQEIGLDEAQRKALRAEVQAAQHRFLDLQLDLQEESEKLVRLVQETPVDEARVLAEVDRILALEKEVKKTHLSLLVRIKNLLRPAQHARLSQLQKEAQP